MSNKCSTCKRKYHHTPIYTPCKLCVHNKDAENKKYDNFHPDDPWHRAYNNMPDLGYEWIRVVGTHRQLKDYIGYVFQYTTSYHGNVRLCHVGRIVSVDECKVTYEDCGKEKIASITHSEEYAILKKEYDEGEEIVT